MAAVGAPRLTGGVIASVLFHGGIVAAFVVLRPPAAPPSPPVYRVQLIAAASGPREIGVVQPASETPPVENPPPVTKTVASRPKVQTPKAKTTTPPKAATATAAPNPPESKKTPEPQPTAAGGDNGGKGADVANIDTNGLEFPYPWYTTNVVSRILRQFRSNARYTAEVRFVIQRDGTVDPSSIKIVTSSGNYTFDTQALGAVEAASRNKALGALPPGFREDILPVTFRFSPANGR